MSMGISLTPMQAKIILCINRSSRFLVVCKGYGEDFENFTELVYPDDRHLDFFDQESYPEFQLWVY